jgi:guanylate kinase
MADHHTTGRVVILAGPSCVGKSPLARALACFHPALSDRLQPIVLYNSRNPRPGEADGVDYHFRSRDQIRALGADSARYVVMDVRGDLQALDLNDLDALLAKGDAFFEGNPFVARLLLTHERLQAVPRLSMFVAPLSCAEILSLRAQPAVCLPAFVADVMRRKLLRRMSRQRGELSLPDLEEVERRCRSAYAELRFAHLFDHVIPNHDGEDSEHWEAFHFPVGDARRALSAVASLLDGRTPENVERWDESLLPDTAASS